MRVVVDRHITASDHLEFIAAHHDRRVFVEADPQQFGVRFDHTEQVELPIPPKQMLIDGCVSQEPKPHHVVAHHDGVGGRVAAREI